jgi:hypothetical protein
MASLPPADPKILSPEILAEAAAEMERVLDREPHLGDFGFDVWDRRKTSLEMAAELARQRDDILSSASLAAFIATRAWLRRHNKRKTINKSGTSYGLKHIAERDVGYITNGVFIAAAVAEGFRVVRDGDGPNAWLNISETAWNRRAAQIYPSEFRLRRSEMPRCPPLNKLDYSFEVVVDEWSARTAADGTYFVARILLGLRDTAEDLRRRADNVWDRTRFEKAQQEIADAIQRLSNSWDGRASALEIIVDEFSVEAITQQTDFVVEILRELRRTARFKGEFADDYSRDRLQKTGRDLDDALQRLDAQEGGEA